MNGWMIGWIDKLEEHRVDGVEGADFQLDEKVGESVDS